MGSSIDASSTLHLVLQAAQRAVSADGASIDWPDSDGTFVFRDAIGITARYVGARLAAARSLGGLCFERGEAVLCDDSEIDDRVNRGACRAVGARSLLAVPILCDGRPVGVLKMVSSRPRAFGWTSARLLEPLADVIGAASRAAEEDGPAPGMVTALEESEERFRTFMDKVPGLAWIKDRAGRYLYVNAPHAAHFGVEPGWLVGRADTDYLPADVAQALAANDQRVLDSGGTLETIESVPAPAGGVRSWLTIKFPLDLQGARVVGGIAVDITERRRLERSAGLTERLTAVGTLAAGVAHEVNNPLAYVIGNLEAMTGELHALAPSLGAGALTELEQMVAETLEGAQRVNRIVQTLKVFARDSRSEARGPVDLLQAVHLAVAQTRQEVAGRATLELDLRAVPVVVGELADLAQVFANLLTNAARSLPHWPNGPHRIRVSSRTGDSGKAIVEVYDTGPGIPRELVGRIFDPFFTTRPVGAGIGLGLSVCHSIVTSLGGEIGVESMPGATTFRVVLPAA